MGQTGELSILDETGDTRIQWDQDQADQVTAARDRFDQLKKKGYAAFSVTKSGDKGEQIDAFDPKLERILFIPPVVGG